MPRSGACRRDGGGEWGRPLLRRRRPKRALGNPQLRTTPMCDPPWYPTGDGADLRICHRKRSWCRDCPHPTAAGDVRHSSSPGDRRLHNNCTAAAKASGRIAKVSAYGRASAAHPAPRDWLLRVLVHGPTAIPPDGHASPALPRPLWCWCRDQSARSHPGHLLRTRVFWAPHS
jgi:hypothetical protein